MLQNRERKLMKYIFFVPFLLLLAVVLYTTSYYFLEIRPHADALSEKVNRYTGDSENHRLIENMARKEAGTDGVFRYVVRTYGSDYIENRNQAFQHIESLNWYFWFKVLYSEEQIFSLWLSKMPYESGRGVYGASRYYFNEDFKNISCRQVLQLVVMVRSPTRFRPGGEASEKRIQEVSSSGLCH